jgi:hypothetical protein
VGLSLHKEVKNSETHTSLNTVTLYCGHVTNILIDTNDHSTVTQATTLAGESLKELFILQA